MSLVTSRSIHRILLEDMIKLNSSKVTGKVLDIGSKNRRYDSIFSAADSIEAIDIAPEGNDVMKADCRSLPYKNGIFDTVVSFEVLEYVQEVDVVFKEVQRVLRSGGTFIFSVPFLDPVHGDPLRDVAQQFNSKGVDLVRHTSKGLYVLLNNYFTEIDIIPFGGRWSIITDFIFEKPRKMKYLRILVSPFYFLFYKISHIFDEIEKNRRFVMGYFCICKKK